MPQAISYGLGIQSSCDFLCSILQEADLWPGIGYCLVQGFVIGAGIR